MNRLKPPCIARYATYAVVLLSVLPIINCGLLDAVTQRRGGDRPEPEATTQRLDRDQPEPEAITLSQALAVSPEDRRPTVLDELGIPDAFSIRFEELEGQVVRWESWSYFDFGHAFDFVDGELLWTVELEPIPDASLYAHFYAPDDFRPHMSTAEVRELLVWQSLAEIDLSEGEIEDGVILAGDQILLGFDNDRLVYVETLILTPAESGRLAGPLPTPTPQAGAPAASTPPLAGALLFQDDFDSVDPQVSALLDTEAMTFEQADGRGRLTSNLFWNLVIASYSVSLPRDLIVEFEVETKGLWIGAEAGLLFRSTLEDQLARFYYLALRPEDHHVGLQAWLDGAWVLRDFRPIPATLVPEDDAYHLRLEVQGDRFRVFVNGGFVTEFTDAQIPDAGGLALTMVTLEPPQSVFFDNLRVYALQ